VRIKAGATTLVCGLLLGQAIGCGPTIPADPPAPEPTESRWGHQVVRRYPHDPKAYTQGLVYADGVLFESTGLKGESSVRRVDLATGRVLQFRANRPDEFAEGLALWGGRLVQLTLDRKVVHSYDPESLDLLESRGYPYEGWGLTHDGKSLIASDGTPTLRFLDPDTLAVRRQIQVHDGPRLVPRLNELEYIDGLVWANVYLTDRVAVVDPSNGEVRAWLDLGGLLTAGERTKADVLNGIAYDAAGNRIFVTGKDWPWLFEIEVAGR
jgi:glutamine cyclotransferase